MWRCSHGIDRHEEACAFCAADKVSSPRKPTSVWRNPLDGSPISEHDYKMMREYADLTHASHELSDEIDSIENDLETYGNSGFDMSGSARARAELNRRLSEVSEQRRGLSRYAEGGQQLFYNDMAEGKAASEQRARDSVRTAAGKGAPTTKVAQAASEAWKRVRDEWKYRHLPPPPDNP